LDDPALGNAQKGEPETGRVPDRPESFASSTGNNPALNFFTGRKPVEIRNLEERMDATLREMGVTFDFVRGEPADTPWVCDILPHIFSDDDWQTISAGFRQRLRAYELFLADVYGKKDILRAGVLPLQSVLGSPHYQRVCPSLSPAEGAYLHLAGMAITRDDKGRLVTKNHYFSHASGVAYMMQNRRVLARVVPEIFRDFPVTSIANTPLDILEKLRAMTPETHDPTVVLLSPGTTSAVYSEHSFLARRMGIPLVQGGDLLVLDDCVYLKTVSGLEKVETIYTRVADAWLDPMVFRRDSRLGVPGLVHCVRKGTVALVNGIGSQLADDRTLLNFSAKIIRFYLGETSILPSLPTLWLGDIDQREMVLSQLDKYRIRPLTGERILGHPQGLAPTEEQAAAIRLEVRKHPQTFVAQLGGDGETTPCFSNGKLTERVQDHIVFALRRGSSYEVFPGALTRVAPAGSRLTASFFGSGSKDSWISARAAGDDTGTPPEISTSGYLPPSRQVTSRVADGFYWMGRYLERALSMAYMIQVVETLELEELTSAERKLYRPLWNRILPPLEPAAGAVGRRSIASASERYRLMLDPAVPGTVIGTLRRAMSNAESLQESLSPEAWGTLVKIQELTEKIKFTLEQEDASFARTTRRVADLIVNLIPQFFAIAQGSMLADNGWNFCEIGQMLERAVITGNAIVSIEGSLTAQSAKGPKHSNEIELSAFLRLLGTRDAYRRVYQMRTAPAQVLEILWRNPEVPRSVTRCLKKCAYLLRESMGPNSHYPAHVVTSVEELIFRINQVNWQEFFIPTHEDDVMVASPLPQVPPKKLSELLNTLLRQTANIHNVIADSFLNHQAIISQREQLLFTSLR
jgi:uncharacterized circularly permuted ATP-grasp superfamily protein/uncharacterized alpha-E superfamily protein